MNVKKVDAVTTEILNKVFSKTMSIVRNSMQDSVSKEQNL